jgi:hypothetical protein
MKKAFVLSILVLTFGTNLARADTLDFSDWSVRMTTVQAGSSGTPQPPDVSDQLSVELTARGLTALRSTYFDDQQTVADYLLVNPKVARRLDRLHPQASLFNTRFMSDGTVANEYRMPLTGLVLQTLMPRTGGGVPVGPMACPTCGQPWPENKEVPTGVTLVPLDETGTMTYTGVLIDARGIEFSPALFPRLVNEDGRTVYGPEFFIASYATERGSVGYYSNAAAAQIDDRLGFNPIRINALKAFGRNPTDLVIANAEARRLHGSVDNLKLLERCRVIILTD